MPRRIVFAASCVVLAVPLGCHSATSAASPEGTAPTTDALADENPMPSSGLWTLRANDLDGDDVDLSGYRGKVALVVNVASECGATPQYRELQALYDALEPRGFVVLGFPSNEFGGQEPGSPEEIRAFCTAEYGVTFPLFEKVSVRAGAEQSPVYEYLASETGATPTWNFCKYLVNREGEVLAFFPTKVTPNSPELVRAIEAALL